jgi:hypothetical protein
MRFKAELAKYYKVEETKVEERVQVGRCSDEGELKITYRLTISLRSQQ